MTKIKLTQIGNSTGLVLPKEVIAELNLVRGDSVYLTRLPDGGYRITPYDPDFADTIEAARDYMRRHRDALKELAK